MRPGRWRDRLRAAACALLLGCGAEEPPRAPADAGASPAPATNAPAREPSAAPAGAPAARPAAPGDRGTPPGLWWKFRGRETLSKEARETFEALQALGYVTGSLESSAAGVTIHDRARVQQGLNFYTSGHAPEAFLMDMDGKVLHRWRYDVWDAWPDYPVLRNDLKAQWWRRAHLYENGDILAIFDLRGIVRLSRDSKLIWTNLNTAHHDLDVLPDGRIYVLVRDIARNAQGQAIHEDFIAVLGPDGVEQRRVSLLASLENSPFASLWHQSPQQDGDIFHTNTVTALRGRIADRLPPFRSGNALVSMLTLGTIAVVDMEREQVAWAHTLHPGEPSRGQHDPRILDNGHLLVFDNNAGRRQSSVLELEPLTREVLWRYDGRPQAPFHSAGLGAAERLPNGNTLITESDNGRVFEITPQGETVWEFYNPERAGENDEFIAAIPELQRLPPDFPVAWLRGERAVPTGE